MLAGLAIAAAGCATGLVGGDPIQRDALALRVPESMTAEALGARIQQGGYEFAMISTTQDSAFLAAAATRAALQMTRPGRIGNATYTFFGPKPLGDTTHTVMVQGGGQRVARHRARSVRRTETIQKRKEGTPCACVRR